MWYVTWRHGVCLMFCIAVCLSACGTPQETYRIPNVMRPQLYPDANDVSDQNVDGGREIIYDSITPCQVIAVWYQDKLTQEGWGIFQDERPAELVFTARTKTNTTAYILRLKFSSQNAARCRVTYFQREQGPA